MASVRRRRPHTSTSKRLSCRLLSKLTLLITFSKQPALFVQSRPFPRLTVRDSTVCSPITQTVAFSTLAGTAKPLSTNVRQVWPTTTNSAFASGPTLLTAATNQKLATASFVPTPPKSISRDTIHATRIQLIAASFMSALRASQGLMVVALALCSTWTRCSAMSRRMFRAAKNTTATWTQSWPKSWPRREPRVKVLERNIQAALALDPQALLPLAKQIIECLA